VNIPSQTPALTIMSPRVGSTVIAGQTMRLWGALTIPGLDDVKESDVKATWFIDGRQVADTLDVFVAGPRTGKHRVRLAVAVRGKRVATETTFQSVMVPTAEELKGEHG
jgi:hypothetical protein